MRRRRPVPLRFRDEAPHAGRDRAKRSSNSRANARDVAGPASSSRKDAQIRAACRRVVRGSRSPAPSFAAAGASPIARSLLIAKSAISSGAGSTASARRAQSLLVSKRPASAAMQAGSSGARARSRRRGRCVSSRRPPCVIVATKARSAGMSAGARAKVRLSITSASDASACHQVAANSCQDQAVPGSSATIARRALRAASVRPSARSARMPSGLRFTGLTHDSTSSNRAGWTGPAWHAETSQCGGLRPRGTLA